jgi:O-6-methylguanine DNA methyltransferase
MIKNNNKDLEQDDFEAFMESIKDMDPEEVQLTFQNMIALMEEQGEPIPFSMRLLASPVSFGLIQTPVGLVYGVSGAGQLMLTGFISEEDIEENGSAEALLEMIVDDFKDCTQLTVVRNDEAFETIIKSALDGSYQVVDDIFETINGTELEEAVWKEITKIPYGETISYEELARRVGNPKAVRAVASAVGQNPISIGIPCHRVILKSGELGNYHWGADIKEKLISYEQARKQA